MKLLLTLPLTILTCWLMAQAPVNDDCSGIIDLGVAPYCSAAGEFTNVNATTSNIDPAFNIPNCFNNNAERDVWFQFTLPSDGSIVDISVSVFGNIGGNGTLKMPELAIYRGDCSFGGLSELACAAAPLNINELQLDFLGLNPGETYFLRINDYSATGTPNAGTFKLCIQEYIADFNMGEVAGTESCSGTLWDSGGEDDPYSSNENLTFTICPLNFHQCIQINLVDYLLESGSDFLRIYEGNGTTGPLVAEFDGSGSNDVVYVAGTGCATVEFESDQSVEFAGFQLTWECSSELCPAPPPVPPSASTCETAISINGCDTELPNYITLAPGQGDPQFITDNVNAGCILNPSTNFNFSFFYFTAQADGDFGFLVKNGDPSNPSDVDFSVWGPINNVADICDFVTNNQPVRSSWTAGPSLENPDGLTGLTDTDPYSGTPIDDAFDCGSPATPGTTGNFPDDSFVKTLPVQEGKIYVILLDDYDGAVQSSDGISIDFAGTSSGVLDLNSAAVSFPDDVTICPGESVQLTVTGGLDYAWAPGNTLSCNQCPNPFALPAEPTTYHVQVATVCAILEDSVKVDFLDLDLGPDANVCLGATFTLNENPYPGQYVWSGIGINCDTCASPTFTATDPGIFILVCIVTTPFCSDTDIIRINVAPGLQPDLFITPDTAICVGDLLTIGGPSTPGITYAWSSNPAGFSSTSANPPPVSPASTTTYFVKATSPACAFSRTDSVVVEVYKRPVVSLIAGASFCFGDSVVLGNTPFQPLVTYAWTPDDGSISDVHAANPTVTPLSPGTHIYTVKASSPGCSISQTVPIVAVDLSLNLNVEDSILLCKGTAQEIVATVSPNANNPLNWSPIQSIQISPDGHSALVSPENDITYTITTSVPGCTRSKKVFVKVDSLPQFLGISPIDTSVCVGNIVLLKYRDDEPLYEPGLFPEMTFQWTPGDGQMTADTLPFLYVNPTDTVVYRRITVNGACADTVFATVNVINPPEMTIVPDGATICPDSAIVLTATATGVEQLLWTPATSLSCDDCLNPTATPTSTTTYTLSGVYKSCSVAVSALINVTQPPAYAFPGNAFQCSGDEIQLNSIDDPTVTNYTWTSNPPSTIPSVAQPVVTLQSTGVQSVTFYLDAFNGCYAHDSVTFQVTGVDLTVSPPATVCPETSQLINVSASVGGGTYTWNSGQTTQAIVVVPTETTTYTVDYTLNGCVFSDSVLITVQGQTPEIAFPADAALCPGDTIVLNSVSTPGSTYSWTSDPAGFTSTEAIPDPQVLFQSTTYTVTATSPDGCSITKTLPVTVFNATLQVSGDVKVCAGEPFTVSATGSATGTYVWSPGAINSPSFEETLNSEQTVNYGVLYTFGTPGNECFLTDTVNVMVLRNFGIKITSDPDSVVGLGEELMLDAVIQPSQSVNGFTFTWEENNLTPVGNTQQVTVPITSIDPLVSYTVTVVSPNGCTQEETISFRIVQPDVQIPNAFSPNGDGSNDFFRLAIVEGKVTVEKFEVYNRWGQKVYESAEPEAQWDGRVDGEEASSDVYVYKIRYRRGDGSLILASGEVTLVR